MWLNTSSSDVMADPILIPLLSLWIKRLSPRREPNSPERRPLAGICNPSTKSFDTNGHCDCVINYRSSVGPLSQHLIFLSSISEEHFLSCEFANYLLRIKSRQRWYLKLRQPFVLV